MSGSGDDGAGAGAVGGAGRAQVRVIDNRSPNPQHCNGPPCFLFDISGWRDGALYPLVRRRRAPTCTRSVSRPTRWRRLLAPSPISFSRIRIGATMAPALVRPAASSASYGVAVRNTPIATAGGIVSAVLSL